MNLVYLRGNEETKFEKKEDTGFLKALRQRIRNVVENVDEMGFLKPFVRGFEIPYRRMMRLGLAQGWIPCAAVYVSRACTAQALPKCATFGRALPRLCRSVLLLGLHCPGFAEVCFFWGVHCLGFTKVCYLWACTAQALPKCASSGAFSTLVQGTKIIPVYCKFRVPLRSLNDTETYNLQELHVQ